MAGPALTTGSVVMCAHGGRATFLPVPRVRVGGEPVVAQPLPVVIAGCANPPPPAGVGPCVTAQFVTAAARVRVGGMPLVLQDSQAVCTPTGTPLVVVAANPRVRGT